MPFYHFLYMYDNGGKCLLDMKHIRRITGCRNIEKVWQKIKNKFQVKDGVITQKRITCELRKAKRLIQAKRKSGLKGAKIRWQNHGEPNGTPDGESVANKNKNKNENKNIREEERNEIEKEEEIVSNTYSNSRLRFPVSSNSLRGGPNGPLKSRCDTGSEISVGRGNSERPISLRLRGGPEGPTHQRAEAGRETAIWSGLTGQCELVIWGKGNSGN